MTIVAIVSVLGRGWGNIWIGRSVAIDRGQTLTSRVSTTRSSKGVGGNAGATVEWGGAKLLGRRH